MITSRIGYCSFVTFIFDISDVQGNHLVIVVTCRHNKENDCAGGILSCLPLLTGYIFDIWYI